jgi:2-octaprenyl-6-methoxyphenol hydroxylase
MQNIAADEIYDVAIVGGGMIGSSLALALSALPLKIVVIEPYPQNSDVAPGFDARAMALSWGTMRIFKSLGLSAEIEKISTAITKIHVSDKGHPGICRLSADQFNVSAMGQVVELKDMGQIVHRALDKTKTTQYCPAAVTAMQEFDEYRQLTLEVKSDCTESKPDPKDASQQYKTIEVKAKLVVAADGNSSVIREMAGLDTVEKPYDQVAIITTLETQLPANHVAFERFTKTGPVAFLPLSDNRISMVWMVDKAISEKLIEDNDTDFIEQLQQQFGFRLGKINRVGKRYSYPLVLVMAKKCFAKRLVLIGNAAQSLHPIAGQGFNLGIRDVACLADSLREADDVGSLDMLEEYQEWRMKDKNKVIGFTDSVARLFANPSKLLTIPRNKALILMNLVPQLRSHIAEAAMGVSGKQSRLVRGLPLTQSQSQVESQQMEKS